jgi:hypothetical protein
MLPTWDKVFGPLLSLCKARFDEGSSQSSLYSDSVTAQAATSGQFKAGLKNLVVHMRYPQRVQEWTWPERQRL